MEWEESEWKEFGTVFSVMERLYGVMNYELDPIRHMLDLDQLSLCGHVIHKI
jgi:hypothetical protein